MGNGVTSRQQNAVGSFKAPGCSTTSSGHPRRFVVPGTTSTLRSRRFMLSADSTSTGRRFEPAAAHQISPRFGVSIVTRRHPDRPTRRRPEH
jgi:hypothetical protein